MKKTTIYLPDDMKKKVEAMAEKEKKSEADVIRDAISSSIERAEPVYPTPRIPLPGMKLGDPTIAERAGDLMDGFGE